MMHLSKRNRFVTAEGGETKGRKKGRGENLPIKDKEGSQSGASPIVRRLFRQREEGEEPRISCIVFSALQSVLDFMSDVKS